MLFIATTRINEAGSVELASKRRVKAGYDWFFRSSKSGVRFDVRYEHLVPIVLAAESVKTGGEGRNRTRSSPAASLNTLIYRGILTLILLGFKQFSVLHATRRLYPATHTPPTRLLKKSLKVSLKVFGVKKRHKSNAHL